MNEQEENKSHGNKEMDGACRLTASEQCDRSRDCGIKGRRHGQARPDFQREQDEDHEQIREPLKNVVGACVGLTGPRKA